MSKNICRVEGCTNEVSVKVHRLCSQHSNQYYEAGRSIGIYRVFFKCSDKFYIGQAVKECIKTRYSKHKNYLIKDYLNRPNDKERKLLKYFNEVCEENPNLTREQVFDKYVDYEEVEGENFMSLWEEIELANGNVKVNISNRAEDTRDSFELIRSKNPGIKKEMDKVIKFWSNKEKNYIKKYKELDKKNNTQNCLNTNN